ncbi:MAG TPA: DcaP family trimeric outer membrane transporter, partial [Gemmataceae bacterium]|nr:DcaP family trimeric outer membrane transporter [Gemmataceae bacterium]
MRTRWRGRPTRIIFSLAAAVLAGLGGTNPAWAQAQLGAPHPAPAAQPAKQVIPEEAPFPSQVFPEGGFPATRPAPEGGIPAAVAKPGQVASYPPLKLPPAEYAPPGYQPPEFQDAPGAIQYRPPLVPGPGAGEIYTPTQLPSYDYFLTAVGPHEYADYAPPGYEAREPTEGQVPGVPEFTPITVPVPVTPEERQKFLTRGLAPGSFLVPGTNTSFRLRGFVRLTGMYDFNPIGTPDIFVTNTIPVPQQSGNNFNYTARPSRFALETWTPTSINDWNVHTFIEGDFFNGPGQAVGGGGNPFRLRFAFIDFGYFRVGQQNTVFMDGNTWPSLIDFQGPAAWVNQ